jgi:DNA-directed RNA polymerase subunit RPC12/RpoP
MENYRDSQTCMAKTGLLFLRDCGSMMINNCQTCGRPVCRVHSIETEQGILCPECAASTPKNEFQEEAGVRSSAQRRTYYDRYGYAPYYYGHTHYYSDHDYRTFDGQDTVDVEPPEEGAFAMADDDGMES